MILHQRFAAIGQFLFRFRSFLPPAMLVGLAWMFWETIPRDVGYSAYVWRAIAGGLALSGVALRCATIGRVPRGTSGRNTKRQKASVLNTTGSYSVVRNPLYLGNALVWIGITLLMKNPVLTVAFGLGLFIYYTLIVFAEEEYLIGQFGGQYASYASRTPALVPRLGGWIPSDRPFSWRMVIRREHDSVFSTATGFILVLHFMDVHSHLGRFVFRREWAIPWLAIMCLWIALKVIKQYTQWLHVPREGMVAPQRTE